MCNSSQNGSKKSYIRDLQKYSWAADSMPKKEWRKWKKAERQRGKDEIESQLNESCGISEDDNSRRNINDA